VKREARQVKYFLREGTIIKKHLSSLSVLLSRRFPLRALYDCNVVFQAPTVNVFDNFFSGSRSQTIWKVIIFVDLIGMLYAHDSLFCVALWCSG